jgi:hypothetical protein
MTQGQEAWPDAYARHLMTRPVHSGHPLKTEMSFVHG